MKEHGIERSLSEIGAQEHLGDKKDKLKVMLEQIISEEEQVIHDEYKNTSFQIDKKVLVAYLTHLLEQTTLERFDLYYSRLVKALTEKKTTPYNDINLNRWKEYEDILTDSLWLIKERDKSGVHSGDYWGNFVPQIPNQLLKRYTKEGEWVLDPFLGSGTTLIEASRLRRHSIGIELQPSVAEMARERMMKEQVKTLHSEIVVGDSQTVDLAQVMERLSIEKVQFLLMHPPYWDIIQFSDREEDLSNTRSLEAFLEGFGQVVDNTLKVLETGRFAAVVIGDKYEAGEWMPLGFHVMQTFLNRGCQLKSIIVKNFEETKGKRNQKNLWRYRALAGGFYLFKHEYIFIFRKTKE